MARRQKNIEFALKLRLSLFQSPLICPRPTARHVFWLLRRSPRFRSFLAVQLSEYTQFFLASILVFCSSCLTNNFKLIVRFRQPSRRRISHNTSTFLSDFAIMQSLLRWGIENSTPSDSAPGGPLPAPRSDLNPEIIDMLLGKSDAEQMKEDLAVAVDATKSEDDRTDALDHLEMVCAFPSFQSVVHAHSLSS